MAQHGPDTLSHPGIMGLAKHNRVARQGPLASAKSDQRYVGATQAQHPHPSPDRGIIKIMRKIQHTCRADMSGVHGQGVQPGWFIHEYIH